MSIASYERNRARRVAGPHLPVCLPAALEQVSTHYGYRPQVYRDYREFDAWWGSFKPIERNKNNVHYEEMLNNLLKPLGGLACEDVRFSHATNPRGWLWVVRQMLSESMDVVADINYSGHTYVCHSVGILPTPQPDYVTLVSTHLPKKLQGIVPLQRVAEHMFYVPEIDKPSARYPFNDANIMGIPAA
jgi:hypothetical protein